MRKRRTRKSLRRTISASSRANGKAENRSIQASISARAPALRLRRPRHRTGRCLRQTPKSRSPTTLSRAIFTENFIALSRSCPALNGGVGAGEPFERGHSITRVMFFIAVSISYMIEKAGRTGSTFLRQALLFSNAIVGKALAASSFASKRGGRRPAPPDEIVDADRESCRYFAVSAGAPSSPPPPAVQADEAKPATPMAAAPAPSKSGYVEADGGSRYYYEIRGKGEPLLLLHGGSARSTCSRRSCRSSPRTAQVIGVDLQGHGRTALGDRPISLAAMGDDMAAIVKALGYEQVDVMGYSLGGGVAFRLAVQHPETVRRLVLVSAGFAQDGFYPEMLPAAGAGRARRWRR